MTARPEVDRSAVIMSVRPRYADGLIIAQDKLWEFRRQELPSQVRSLLVYRCGGDAQLRGVIGWFQITRTWLKPTHYWGKLAADAGYAGDQADPRLGLSFEDLVEYAFPLFPVAIERGATTRFAEPVPLARYGVGRAPQSWRYAPAGWETVR